MEKKKIVFLYTEIAGYFLACVKALLLNHEVEVHVVRYDVNKEAPFQFNFPEGLNVYNRNNFDKTKLMQLMDQINPSLIVCSGWIDKDYLAICKEFKTKAVTILTLDNHWRGSLKQYIAKLFSPFYLHPRFSFCWVPGTFQYEYAKRLGFKNESILTGFYSCDYEYFYKQYQLNKDQKQQHFPQRFIYIGRYVEHKGVKDLWRAFIEIQEESPNEWELWCLGTGDVKPVEHPKIKHFGFIQPKDLKTFISKTGVFVLPSHFEPWGVVLHEFAAAGFPLICSTETGAHTAFVENNLNGYLYTSTQLNELKEVLKRVMNMDVTQLINMGRSSTVKAKEITPTIWAKQLISLI